MNDGPARLRRHLAAHNRHVLTVAAGSLVIVLLLWGAVYFAGYWLVLLALTLGDPLGAHGPVSYPWIFTSLAGLAVGLVAWAHWGQPAPRPRDKKRWGEVALDFLLLLPRATIGAVENGRAFQHLSRGEIDRAWTFLQRFEDQRHLPLTALAFEIPHAPTRERILRALQYSQVLELHERQGEWVLALRHQAARRMLGARFRLR